MRIMITEKYKLMIVKSQNEENMMIKYDQEDGSITIEAESLELDILDLTDI